MVYVYVSFFFCMRVRTYAQYTISAAKVQVFFYTAKFLI